MILKYNELKKINLKKQKIILLYGNNQGHKKQVLDEQLKPILPKNIFNYDEIEILKNLDKFKETIYNKSFFENEKLIIINRTSEKILNIIEKNIKQNLEEIFIILLTENLDKKSKIRKLFEKEIKTVCVPFYEDTNQTLNSYAQKFINENKINISQQLLNIIIERARGDRINLKNELEKIQSLSISKKNLDIKDILKLSNLSENYLIGNLVDNCLLKNKKKIIQILNENNFSNEDCIVINRIFLNKAKKLLNLSQKYELNNDIDLTISSAKPPIFWKERETVKQQIREWPTQKIKNIIFKLSDIELLIKKNINNSVNLITNFILEVSFSDANN